MTHDGGGLRKKPANGILAPDQKPIRIADPKTTEKLRQIAESLGVPMERFYAFESRLGDSLRATGADASEQGGRLLTAFGRITDPQVRDQIVAMVEALAGDA